MKMLRTIRLDPSDTFIYPTAAPPGEWAISGSFVFGDAEPASLEGKILAAFRSGFLGAPSLGWSTLAQVVKADGNDRLTAIELIAECLLRSFGAPDFDAARAAATEEIDFATSLCDHPPDTLIAVRRVDEGGAIRELFRTLRPRPGAQRWHVFSYLDAASVEPAELVDLAALARGDRL